MSEKFRFITVDCPHCGKELTARRSAAAGIGKNDPFGLSGYQRVDCLEETGGCGMSFPVRWQLDCIAQPVPPKSS